MPWIGFARVGDAFLYTNRVPGGFARQPVFVEEEYAPPGTMTSSSWVSCPSVRITRAPLATGLIVGVVGIATVPFMRSLSSPVGERIFWSAMRFRYATLVPVFVHGSHASPRPSPSASA